MARRPRSMPVDRPLRMGDISRAGQANLTRMWAVEDNLILGANTPVTNDGPLKQKVQFRGNQPGPQ